MIKRNHTRTEKIIREQFEPDFRYPTFEENLEKIHEMALPFDSAAEIVTPHGTMRVAKGKREVFYLKYDEQSSQFAALSGALENVPEAWSAGILNVLPQVAVGEIYDKNSEGQGLGRIISAEVVEANSVIWKNGNNYSGGNKKDKKFVRSLLPKGLHASPRQQASGA